MTTTLMIKRGSRYVTADREAILAAATTYLVRDLVGEALTQPSQVRDFLRTTLGPREHECFCVVWLDNRHRVLAFDELFRGTVDRASVFPREVVKSALQHNAAACILAHNHPSGALEPSSADELITRRLKDALALIDVRILDHMIATREGVYSFSEHGLL